jgi:hypothetical protein
VLRGKPSKVKSDMVSSPIVYAPLHCRNRFGT